MDVQTMKIRHIGGSVQQPAWGGINITCYFWKEGKCTRNPCRFVHGEPASPYDLRKVIKQAHALPYARPNRKFNNAPKSLASTTVVEDKSSKYSCSSKKILTFPVKDGRSIVGIVRKIVNSDSNAALQKNRDVSKENSILTTRVPCVEVESAKDNANKDVEAVSEKNCLEDCDKRSLICAIGHAVDEEDNTVKSVVEACKLKISGNVTADESSQFSQLLFDGDWFSMLASLKGHDQAISGVALPGGSDKLYSGSSDGTIRVWCCYTGQCVRVTDLGDKVGCLISEGPWVFVGIPNGVKAWNIETGGDFHLSGPVGQVHCFAVALDILFAGVQDGSIVTWRGSTETTEPFQLDTSLKGHTGAVTCLVVGAMKLYSGSMDGTIRVWDVYSLQSFYTLNVHTDSVMSLICWNQYIISCSLDQTIKVWLVTEGGNLEMASTLEEDHGPLTLCGINDAEAKPILLCSFNDDENSVRLYELPSFTRRGTIRSKQQVRAIGTGPYGLFFTGDGTGLITVWNVKDISAAES